jgi:hypothetical protein
MDLKNTIVKNFLYNEKQSKEISEDEIKEYVYSLIVKSFELMGYLEK